VSSEEPEYWPVGRTLSLTEAIQRLTCKIEGPRRGSVFVGELRPTKDNGVFLQDLTLLGHYLEYVAECRARSPREVPSFNSFPRYFDQVVASKRFRVGVTAADLTQACDRIESQFLVTLFPRSYGVAKTNLGEVDLNGGRLRVDLQIKRETVSPTPTGWAYGRIGQVLLHIQELSTHLNDGSALRSHIELISKLTDAVVDTAIQTQSRDKSQMAAAYLDLIRTTTTAVVDNAERRISKIIDPRSFLAKQSALPADDEGCVDGMDDEDAVTPTKPVRIGRVVRPKSRKKVHLLSRWKPARP
jgi:hypothetical protein